MLGESSEPRSEFRKFSPSDEQSISLRSGEILFNAHKRGCEFAIWTGLWFGLDACNTTDDDGGAWLTDSKFEWPFVELVWAAGGWLGTVCPGGLCVEWAGSARLGGAWLFGPFIKP